MRRTFKVLGLLALCLSLSSSASAAIIYLGNVNGNDTLTGVNNKISAYNLAQGTSYDLMTDFLAKWDCKKVAGTDCAAFDTTSATLNADLFNISFDDTTKKQGKWMYAGFEDWAVGAFVVKASNSYSVYLLDPPQASVGAPGELWHTFNIFNGGGQNPKLSHLSWYGLEVQTPDCQQNCGDQTIPEPATLALVGLGLLGAGLARRRRQS